MRMHYFSVLFFVSGLIKLTIKPPKIAKYKVLLTGLEVIPQVPLAHPTKSNIDNLQSLLQLRLLLSVYYLATTSSYSTSVICLVVLSFL